ncbi:OmpA family protein [Flavisolibacter sp. BT320]|nr:OmpA family protein [Flavisolibacter longurius]
MKKIIVIILLSLPVIGISQQNILSRLKDKAQARGEQRLDEAMDKALDKAENEASGKPKSKKGADTTKPEVATTALPKAGEQTGREEPSFSAYSKYDFVPGERIVYAEDFGQDELGELPLKWNTNNRGETVTLQGLPGKWMQLFNGSRFASPALQTLPANFTLEMDLLFRFSGEGGYVYPQLEIKFLQLLSSDAKANQFVSNQDAAKELALLLQPDGADRPLNASFQSFDNGSGFFSNQTKELKGELTLKPVHLSVWVQKNRVRYWINGDKVFDMPQAVPDGALFNRIGFSLESSLYTPDQFSVFVTNIKVAEGTPDLRSKFQTEGKWVTTGILFDVASDRIRPESAGVLREIAAVLKENSSYRVKIIGHTDADGEDAGNMALSKRRAAAVKNALRTEFGIDAGRLETDGLGETKPIADNGTKEGKAKNRRVEFIKL